MRETFTINDFCFFHSLALIECGRMWKFEIEETYYPIPIYKSIISIRFISVYINQYTYQAACIGSTSVTTRNMYKTQVISLTNKLAIRIRKPIMKMKGKHLLQKNYKELLFSIV